MYSRLIPIMLVAAAAYVVGSLVAYADPLMRPFAIILVVAIGVGLWLLFESLAKKVRLAEEKLLIVRCGLFRMPLLRQSDLFREPYGARKGRQTP